MRFFIFIAIVFIPVQSGIIASDMDKLSEEYMKIAQNYGPSKPQHPGRWIQKVTHQQPGHIYMTIVKDDRSLCLTKSR